MRLLHLNAVRITLTLSFIKKLWGRKGEIWTAFFRIGRGCGKALCAGIGSAKPESLFWKELWDILTDWETGRVPAVLRRLHGLTVRRFLWRMSGGLFSRRAGLRVPQLAIRLHRFLAWKVVIVRSFGFSSCSVTSALAMPRSIFTAACCLIASVTWE